MPVPTVIPNRRAPPCFPPSAFTNIHCIMDTLLTIPALASGLLFFFLLLSVAALLLARSLARSTSTPPGAGPALGVVVRCPVRLESVLGRSQDALS